MTFDHETLTILASLIALVISVVSMVRTRQLSSKQLELERHNAELAKKQLQMLEAEEEYQNQPRFIIKTNNIWGANPEESGYKVRANIEISNIGADYLKPGFVVIISWDKEKIARHCPNAELRSPTEPGRHELPFLGTHELKLQEGSNLGTCFLHISYQDLEGYERIQEYEIFSEGFSEHLPSEIRFVYKRNMRISASEWVG